MTITAEHEPTQADNVQALIAEEITWAESETWRPQPDRLTAQIEIYEENVILRLHKEDRVVTRRIHPKDLADLFAGDIVFTTGLLPDDTLWHVRSHAKRITALWREPRVWPVALQYKPFEDPRRLMLPMPGLVFLCTPSTPPRVFAAKAKPTSKSDQLYRGSHLQRLQQGRRLPRQPQVPQGCGADPGIVLPVQVLNDRGLPQPLGKAPQQPLGTLGGARWPDSISHG